ncbi:GTP binding protein, partial [Blyttiomyces sp. JEL0837]
MDLGRAARYENSFMVEKVKGNALPGEIEEGNVEYKASTPDLKLIDPTPERIEHLVTQMKWRLAEGHGEAMYEVGVADNGELVGLSRKDMESSLKTLRTMGERLRADVSIIRERRVTPPKRGKTRRKPLQQSEMDKAKKKQREREEVESGFFGLDMDDFELDGPVVS